MQQKNINNNIYQEIKKGEKKVISKMSQQSYGKSQEQNRMFFPHQNRQDMSYNKFMAFLPYNQSQVQEQIKFQNKNQSFNYFYDMKNQNSRFEPSPEYDLFEIQKKRKKQKYKRSTNNSHKKFISALRRLFYAVISTKQKEQFEIKYCKFRSCRTFFFIILAYMRYRFSPKLLNSVRVSFINEMKIKINEYQEEISRTKNMNLKNFREEQIIDIKYSIKSCNQYFQGNTREAIECMYKKDKSTVIKRQHYESALRSVHMIQKELMENPRSPLESPYVEDFSHSSDRQKVERKVIKRQIREIQLQKFALQKEQPVDYGNPFDQINYNYNIQKKKIRITDVTQNPQGESDISSLQKDIVPQRETLYPPLLEAIPYIQYDPFVPPFRYKRENNYRIDARQDFFGPMNFGYPKFYQRRSEKFIPSDSPFSFSGSFVPKV